MRRLRSTLYSVLVISGVIATTFPPNAAAQNRVSGIGNLPEAAFEFSNVTVVSADGTVFGGFGANADFEFEAFVLDASTAIGLLPVGMLALGGGSVVTGLSADGTVLVGNSGIDLFEDEAVALRWDAVNGLQSLADLTDPADSLFPSEANGISGDGTRIVGRSFTPVSGAFQSEAYVWDDVSGIVGLGDLPGGAFSSSANSISTDGLVVVGQGESESGVEAFRWDVENGLQGLGDLPGGDFVSIAHDVSSDGSVIVGQSFSELGTEAFRWTAETGMVGLGDLPGGDFGSLALAVSADGSMIVGSADTALGTEAFIWDAANGMRRLVDVLAEVGVDLEGRVLGPANDVSDDGTTIVGLSFLPDGSAEGFVSVVPEPALGLPISLGMLGWLGRRRSPGRSQSE